jgi:hypothetical protein
MLPGKLYNSEKFSLISAIIPLGFTKSKGIKKYKDF